MISIQINFYQSVIDIYKEENAAFIKEKIQALKILQNDQNQNFTCFEWKYLDLLIENLEDIVFAKPNELNILKDHFLALTRKDKKFKDLLVNALGYHERRSDFYPNFFQKVGINACVYCNAQLTVCVDSIDNRDNKVVKAKFQLDHFLPISNYPCFSISFYNLYPVCASCNNAKKAKDLIKFNLYSDSKEAYEKSEFKFSLVEGCVAKYLTNSNIDLIEIKFKGNLSKSFQETFDIEGIYNTQKDIVEELIIKRCIYNESYKTRLKKSFSKLFNDGSLNKRLLIGNYGEEDEIHKRPMSKFTQDIAKQLGVI